MSSSMSAGAGPEGGRTATPTVFEQQREELVREIAVVSSSSYLSIFNSIEIEAVCSFVYLSVIYVLFVVLRWVGLI